MLTKPSLTIQRRFKASPQKVYQAFTDTAQLVRWFGPDFAPAESAEADLRIGGKYSILMRGKDGEEHRVSGVYREIVTNARLVFTWAWQSTPERKSLVTITIRPDGEGTLLQILHEQFFNEEARDGHDRGWTGSLGKLEHLLTENVT